MREGRKVSAVRLLSNTQEGGRVIELTREEWRQFQILVCAVEGLTAEETTWKLTGLVRENEYVETPPLDGAFGSIRAFYESKFNITKMQNLLDGMKKAVESESL